MEKGPLVTRGEGNRLLFSGVLATVMLLLVAVLGAAGAPQVRAQSAGADANAADSDGAGQLQYRLRIDGDLAAVCAQRGDFTTGPSAVFARGPAGGAWQPLVGQEQASAGVSSHRGFSYALALSGDYAIVGAEWHDDFKGAAYIFKRSGDSWVEHQKLSPTDLGRFDHFGCSVSISGDCAVVGATWQDLFKGAVYVYKRVGDEWVEEQKMVAGDAVPDGRFGWAVRMDGDAITIGAELAGSSVSPGQGDRGPDVAYRFRRAGNVWVEQEKLTLPAEAKGRGPAELAVDSVANSALRLIESIRTAPEWPSEPAPGALTADAPPGPKTVAATDGAYEDRVEITWTSVGLDAIVYRILRDDELISVASSDDSLYADETGVPGVPYDYCVVVKDMANVDSDPTCDVGSRIIFPPEDVSASDGQYDEFVRLLWTDMSFVEEGYLVRREGVEIGTTTANAGVFHDSSAVQGDTYNYEVIAFDSDGNRSLPVSDDGFRGFILPPLAVSASDGEYPDRVRITWEDQAKNEEGYIIYRNGDPLATTVANVKSYEDDDAEPGVTYTYCVTTLGAGSIESIPVCDTGGIGILPAPEEVCASCGEFDDRIEITWKDPSDLEDGFEIRRGVDVLDTTRANVRYYRDNEAEPGTTYDYCVTAISNEGGRSEGVCDEGLQSYVLAPFDVRATDGSFEDRVDISWKSTSTTVVLFKILRDGTLVKTVSKGDRQYSDFGSTAGIKHAYKVIAVEAQGRESEGVTCDGSRELQAPTSITASDDKHESRIVVSWADNSALEEGYVVSRRMGLIQSVGAYEAPGIAYIAYDAAVAGEYAYVAGFASGLQIIDISDPANPSLVGSVDTPGEAHGVAVAGSYAYVADGSSGLRVIDISDPVIPSIVGSADTPGEAYGVAVAGGYAYVADGSSGLRVIDISNPGNASIVGGLDTPGNAHGVSVAGSYAYVADGGSGLQVIDISDSDSGSIIRSVDSPGEAHAVVVAGEYAYVADGSSGLQVIDISDPENASIVGGVDTPGDAYDVAVAGHYAHVADGSSGLQVIDIFDPENATIVGGADTPGEAHGVAVSGGCAYVADYDRGLRIIRLGRDFCVDANRTSYTDDTAVSGITYNYSVSAFDERGEVRGYSSAGEDEGRRVLLAPSGVWATDGAFEDCVKITWTDNSNAEDGYYIYRDGSSIGRTDDNYTSYVDHSPDVGFPGEYRVTAFDAYGESEAASDSGSATILQPTSFNASDVYEDRVELTWVDLSDIEDGYVVYRNGLEIATTASDITSFTDMSALPDTSYEYCVQAFSGGSHSGWFEAQKLMAGDGDAGDSLGVSVAIDSDWAVVGAYKHNNQKGSAYIFQRSADGRWEQRQELEAFDGAAWDEFGRSVAIDRGGSVIVGAPGDENAKGAAYIFLRGVDGTWVKDGKLVATDGVLEEWFGWSVAIDGLQVIVGANKHDNRKGAAYIFSRSADGRWEQRQKLMAEDGAAQDWFGSSVAIDGLQVIAGANGHDNQKGAAYMFQYTAGGTWAQTEKLIASDGAAWDEFGRSVAIDGGRAVVGAPYHDDNGFDSGSAYIFQRGADGTWEQSQELMASGAAVEGFGWSVAIDGGRAVVGAPYHDDNGFDSGSAYIFQHGADGTWAQAKKLVASDGGAGDQFGYCVAIDGDRAIVGAVGDDDKGPESGSAYIFQRGQVSEGVCDDGQLFSPSSDLPPETYAGELTAGNGADGDFFGYSVAVGGDRVIVGAPTKKVGTQDQQGMVYIFEYNKADSTWATEQILERGDLLDQFGWSVAIDGDRVIVGAQSWGHGEGRAYIYERGAGDKWEAVGLLTPRNLQRNTCFGHSVAIDGDRAIVGGPFDDNNNHTDAGAAWIFQGPAESPGPEAKWTEVEKLVPDLGDQAESSWFGWSVGIDGNRVIVGAPSYDGTDQRGAAYIFERGVDGTWGEGKELVGREAGNGERFGMSVAIDGDWAIVGCNGDEDWKGAAYIFKRRADGTWAESSRLMASDAAFSDNFGTSVAMDGDRAIVGAYLDDDNGVDSGSAYIFQRGTGGRWVEVQKLKLVGNAGAASDLLGCSVAIDGERLIVGAREERDGGKGAAYVFDTVWPPGDVAASDGDLKSRVRITWRDNSSNENGFRVYRHDKEDPIAELYRDTEVYDDFDAQPGRTYKYAVVAYKNNRDEHVPVCDFGWRPPNGNITGRVSTRAGAGVKGISVSLNPDPSRALLLDGTGGQVRIPDTHGTLDFSGSYTVELWFKYSGYGGPRGPDGVLVAKADPELSAPGCRSTFVLSNQRADGQPGRLAFQISDSLGSPITVFTKSDSLRNDGTWHHVACVNDAGQNKIRIYVDGTLEGTEAYENLCDGTNTGDLTLGVGDNAGSWFGGQLDEVRIWNVVRTEKQIQASMNLQLTGDEEGLVGYWPLNEGDGGVITDLTDLAHYGAFEGGVYWTDNVAEMDVCAKTDSEGNYVRAGIRYGDETTFKVRPSQGTRQFSPAFKTITLSTGHPVENQVNFTETTMRTVSGTIAFAGTECRAPDVKIRANKEVHTVTDKNGKYAISVENGDYWIRPQLKGRTFYPDSIRISVKDDTSGVDFTDITPRTLGGYVGGGCGNRVGDVEITIRTEGRCIDSTFTVRTPNDYSIELPPQTYMVSAKPDMDTVPKGMEVEVWEFFENLGEREVDLSNTDATLDFVYRAPLEVTITGLERWESKCEPLRFGDRELPGSLPVIPQGTVLEFEIEVYEDYGEDDLGNQGKCPLDSGKVVIYDEIFDQEDRPQELEVRNGVATYISFASTPNLLVGRVDSEGNDRSFQKALRAMVVVEGRTPVTETEWVLVTGHVAPEGADFVTFTATETPMVILRDPPGDNSYAYVEEGTTVNSTLDFDEEMWGGGGGPKGQVFVGCDKTHWEGVGAGTVSNVKRGLYLEHESMFGRTNYRMDKIETSIGFKEKFSTSPNDLFVGEKGDVFVGQGLNYIFTEVGVIEVDDCEVVRSAALGFQPDSIATIFAYTGQYIEDVLIPELRSKVDHYEATHPDSAAIFAKRAIDWQDMLEENERLKREAKLDVNRSFSAGADFSYFFEADTTESHKRVVKFYQRHKGLVAFQFKLDWLGAAFDGTIGGSYEILHDKVLTSSEGDTVVSKAMGYVLSDDDIGDHFTVDVKQDGAYLSPVFDVRAGVSSCPYEPWPDPKDGKARMVPRDKPDLTMSGDRDLFDIHPDEPAAFTLNLGNLNTKEARIYVLREDTKSNPGGAIMKVGGAPMAGGISYYVGPGDTREVTLTVERGPTRYSYKDLAVVLYPPCEYGIWERGGPFPRAGTVSFSVDFITPCSDITLFSPQSGWTYSQADRDSSKALKLILAHYELKIETGRDKDGKPTYKKVTSVGAQYRRLGTGREGPTPWAYIYADTLGKTTTTIEWSPPDSLADGVYELRAFTECDGGRGFSAVSVGAIDRHGPEVLGAPRPGDGELSLGEDIGITFNEPIDCTSIDPDSVTLRYLDGPNAGSTIPVKTVCSEQSGRITIEPADEVDPNDLEGRMLEASVAGIGDLVGNPMEEVPPWTFRFMQSVFTWKNADLEKEVSFRDPGSLSAELVNGGNSTAAFTISSDADWVVGISDSSGSIAPGGTQSVTFEIDEDIPIGDHWGEIEASSGEGTAVLRIHLIVSCHEPVWEVNPHDFEHTMTIVANVDIADTLTDDANDKVAALVGSQFRGVANVDGLTHMAYLTVHSNRLSGETVRFQVWDDSDCRAYNSTWESFPFEANGRVGSPNDPVTLTATDVLPDTVQAIPLSSGWNWFSVNVSSNNMTVEGVLSSLTPEAGDMIKSQTAYAEFDPLTGWAGSLAEPSTLQDLDNVSCYMVRLSEPGTIIQMGSIVDPLITPVPVGTGWNWMGYVPSGSMAIGEALKGLKTTLHEGDMVKSQDAFAQVVKVQGKLTWRGDLDLMEPGKGYKLYLKSSGQSEFYYPNPAGAAAASVPAAAAPGKGVGQQGATAMRAGAVPGGPEWYVAQNAYEYNMTVTAVLRIEGEERRSGDDMIGAFVDGECRGATRPIYLDAINRYVAFLMVHSNEAAGEEVTFKAFAAGSKAVYDVAEALTYEANASHGRICEPLILNTEGSGVSLGYVNALFQNVPNPFSSISGTRIQYSVARSRVVEIRIFDAAGRLVNSIFDEAEVGENFVVWDGRNTDGRPLAGGVYFYQLRAGDFTSRRKMLLVD